MPMHDQPRAPGCRQFVDDGEPVAVTGRGLMRHQHVETLFRQAIDVVRKDRIAVP